MGPLEFVNEQVAHFQESLMNPDWVVNDGGAVGLTQYVLWMFIVLAIVLAVVLVAAKKLQLVPQGKFVGLVEYGYNFVAQDIAEGSIGQGYKKHIPFLATLFFFILVANFVGLIPGCRTPTGTISITWALSLIAFVYFNYYGIKKKGGWGYIKSIAPSGLPKPMVPFIWLLEFISLVIRALTLAVRLFGNMFAGHMALGIFALLATGFFQAATSGVIAAPAAGVSLIWLVFLVFMYALEVLVAFIQAYVFTVLTAVYVSLAEAQH